MPKRPRKVKAPPPLERETHVALVELLDVVLHPAWRYTHIPLGEHRDKRTAAILKRMGVKPGWPDFVFIGPRYSVFFLELKRKGETRSPDQVEVGLHLMHCGHGYLCTDDIRDAITTLRDLGIVRAVSI